MSAELMLKMLVDVHIVQTGSIVSMAFVSSAQTLHGLLLLSLFFLQLLQ